MRKTAILLVGLSTVLAACAAEPEKDEKAAGMDHSAHEGHQMSGELTDKAIKDKKEAAELLVQRFDVAACAEADLIGSLRRTEPDGGGVMMRAFQVTADCANAAKASVEKLGFEEGDAGLFTGTDGDGAAEEVKIAIIGEDSASATIEWEASLK